MNMWVGDMSMLVCYDGDGVVGNYGLYVGYLVYCGLVVN